MLLPHCSILKSIHAESRHFPLPVLTARSSLFASFFFFFLQFPFLKLSDTVLICSPTPPETIELNYIFLIVGEWLGYNYAWKCIT